MNNSIDERSQQNEEVDSMYSIGGATFDSGLL
jgi:hypothetical protein